MSVSLDIHPAFGFETQGRWEIAVQQRMERRNADPSLKDRLTLFQRQDLGRDRMYLNNVSKVVGYFPIANCLVGSQRLNFVMSERETQDPEKIAIQNRHKFRGGLEMLCCFGPILCIFDFIATIRDHCC